MTNYLNILKGCNLFILSSSQENVLPNVLLEADCLGVPILSTNVEQAERLLNAYGGGLIVDQSAEALYEGMIAFDQGKVKPLNIDMCVFNRNAAARMADELTDCQGTYRTVHNCFNYLDVLQKSKLEISFDPRTECATSNTRGILGILDTKAPKFITIGRFSPEKQHLRLLQAFNKYYENVNNDARLIIIGGHGPMYNKTIDAARKLPCANNVCIIKALSNPHSILSKCDLFILPSSHEGLPVVFFEADCLGKPILSTALDGPRELFGTYGGGLLVNQSVEALYEGMLEFDKGNIKPLNIDMEAYNQKCIAEFESLFD